MRYFADAAGYVWRGLRRVRPNGLISRALRWPSSAIVTPSRCSTCGQPMSAPPCSLNPDNGWRGHTVAGNGGRPCVDGRDSSQTSASVDAPAEERRAEVSAQKGTPDLATPGSDNAAGVAGTTGPTS